MSNRVRYYVYRLFDKDGDLLYVGSCYGWADRMGQHLRRQSWGDQIASVTLEQFRKSIDARHREAEVIDAERPRHNNAPGLTTRGERLVQLAQLLRDNGPMSQVEIEKAVEDGPTWVAGTLHRALRSGFLVVAEERPRSGRYATTKVYALAESEVAA